MRLTLTQARTLNIDEDIIRRAEEHASQAERSEAVRERLEVEPPKPKRSKPADGYDSKLNRDFAGLLVSAKARGWIHEWWYEPFGLRLAPKCYYHFDFLVDPLYPVDIGEYHEEHRLVCIECKGGWFRDDAKVKTKVAAEMFPCFKWLLVYREKRTAWDVREVDHRGIGTSPIRVPWLCNL